MKQEFITSRGKIIFENNNLLIRNYKFSLRETLVGKLWFPVLLLLAGILHCIYADEPLDYIIGVFWILFFLLFYLSDLYTTLIKTSFSNRIQLSVISYYITKPDEFGLETELRLYLKNGRYRSIGFRTLEKQFEPFTELLSQYITYPQFA